MINPYKNTLALSSSRILTPDILNYAKMGLSFNSVMNVAWNIRPEYPLRMPVLMLDVDDHDSVSVHVFNMAVAFYNVFRPTLIHCNAGMNRSNCFAAACLVSDGYAVDTAISMTENILQYNMSKELKGSLKIWASLRVK